MVILMLAYVSCAQENSENENAADLNTENSVERPSIRESSKDVMAFSEIEEVPIFPGCEDLTTNEERKECMSQKITEFVSANFNTGLGKELKLEGLNRVYVQFKINTDGTIEVVKSRASHPLLEKEGERVVGELPQMKPGKHNGQEVAVLYSLPISFIVK